MNIGTYEWSESKVENIGVFFDNGLSYCVFADQDNFVITKKIFET